MTDPAQMRTSDALTRQGCAPGDQRPGSDAQPVLEAEAVCRRFRAGGGEVHACREVSLSVAPGELVVLRGASGSGKTTLLNLLAGIDRPDEGRVLIGGRALAEMPERELVATRRGCIGYVFQSFGLIPILSAAENVEVPLRAVATPAAERDARVAEVLGLVGMAGHAGHRPEELSGGQQQRVGMARALANRPRILLADEPTGQLDAATAEKVMDLVARLCAEEGLAAVVATHDPLFGERATRLIEMHDGRLQSVGRHRSMG